MFKRFFGVVLGIGSSPTSQRQPSAGREPPIKTIREEPDPALVSEISYATGHHGFVSVVGELCYQDTLRRLLEFFNAKLIPEPDNPHDSNAVAVKTSGTSETGLTSESSLDFEEVRQSLGLPLMAVDRGPITYDAAAEYHRVNAAARELVEGVPTTREYSQRRAEPEYRRIYVALSCVQPAGRGPTTESSH